MKFDIKCIATTHNLISKSNELPNTTGIVHVTNCKCDKHKTKDIADALRANGFCAKTYGRDQIACLLKSGHVGQCPASVADSWSLEKCGQQTVDLRCGQQTVDLRFGDQHHCRLPKDHVSEHESEAPDGTTYTWRVTPTRTHEDV